MRPAHAKAWQVNTGSRSRMQSRLAGGVGLLAMTRAGRWLKDSRDGKRQAALAQTSMAGTPSNAR